MCYDFKMSSSNPYVLAKSHNVYFGSCSSGPSSSRSLKVYQDPITLCIHEDLHVITLRNSDVSFPVETPVSLSTQAISAVDELIRAYKSLEKAKAQFKVAQDEFKESTGGKEVLNFLCPQERLPVDKVISKTDMDALQTLVEQVIGKDNKIISREGYVAGYNIGVIKFKTEKPILLETVYKIKHNEYFFTMYDYVTDLTEFESDKTNTFQFAKKGDFDPPCRMEDFNEVQEAKEKMRTRRIAKNT